MQRRELPAATQVDLEQRSQVPLATELAMEGALAVFLGCEELMRATGNATLASGNPLSNNLDFLKVVVIVSHCYLL